MTPVSIMPDVWDQLGFHLNPKDLKSSQKWPSYGQFSRGRLRDSSEYHAECKGSIGASFEPKISEIKPEMAKLRPIFPWEVA